MEKIIERKEFNSFLAEGTIQKTVNFNKSTASQKNATEGSSLFDKYSVRCNFNR